ncbi:MAG: sigma-70 family RNA polymerase sigma factor [Desulfosarcina sp.]|nr:sigma-70 family RNA polymerase sigma factor [Desulfosarcina sp.]
MRELVLSAASGSTLAFHRLADLYQDAVYRMVYHRVRSRMDAEDLTQDIFLKAYRNLPRLKTPDRFRSSVDPAAPDGFSEWGRRQFWKTVADILKKMSATEREVFILRFFDQQSIAEIARILTKGESTVKTHLYRAIAKFKAHPASARLEELLP